MNDYTNLRALAANAAMSRVTVERLDIAAVLAEVDALRAAAPAKKTRAKKATVDAAVDTLPPWLPLDAWHAFLAMRVKIKKPATDYAQKLLIKKLAAFYANDLDPGVILNQSIVGGWQDLYAPKEPSTAQVSRYQPRAPMADQVAAAMKKRRDGDGDGFMGMTIDV